MDTLKQIITECGKIPVDVTKMINKPEDIVRLSLTMTRVGDSEKVYIIANSKLVFKALNCMYSKAKDTRLDPKMANNCFMFFYKEGLYHGTFESISKLSISNFITTSEEKVHECNICCEKIDTQVGIFFDCMVCSYALCFECFKKNGKICPICKKDYNA